MVKVRPVVVISPRFRSRPRLCTVVPLSTTSPTPIEAYHHQLSVGAYPPATVPVWAKCDMVMTVSLDRLDRVKRYQGGKRTYHAYAMPPADMIAILACVKIGLGLP